MNTGMRATAPENLAAMNELSIGSGASVNNMARAIHPMRVADCGDLPCPAHSAIRHSKSPRRSAPALPGRKVLRGQPLDSPVTMAAPHDLRSVEALARAKSTGSGTKRSAVSTGSPCIRARQLPLHIKRARHSVRGTCHRNRAAAGDTEHRRTEGFPPCSRSHRELPQMPPPCPIREANR